ncbi:hypothetical protein GcM1_193030 [Golovinomyces cichoracearum]|uniref:Uncharacterized protein n=1 Tax=Golovinomyces cichoracearum TaxID=62708 RepID=A0A420J0Z5_9PEZI|nr:hypothetical protein GcM1_193030 [Golovinomyces cichoracearum]
MIAFPPHRTKVSVNVSQETALAHLTLYLNSSETQPHLLPNAHLDPTIGPTIGSSNYSITIHNLRRVQAGLRGELLAPSIELNETFLASKQQENFPQPEQIDGAKLNIDEKMPICIEESHAPENHQELDQPVASKTEIINSEITEKSITETRSSHIDKEARKREKKARRKAAKKDLKS